MDQGRLTKKAATSAPPPPWIELPHDITANILQRLGAKEILESAQKVCMTWRNVCKVDPSMWRKIHLYRGYIGDESEIMCRHAVDRSQGQLVEITIGYFGTDMLLQYIAESVEFFGELIEQVGRSCPLLKSFTLCNPVLSQEEEDDADALAIAKSMPELRHLRLVYTNPMTNNGLEAILDGCPSLESLDLELSLKFDLSGDLGERCSQQIKSLKIADTDNHFCDPIYDSEPSDIDSIFGD